MPTYTWNEIRVNAAQFAERWADTIKENAESQSFWNEFLGIYGIDRRRVASFERRVKGLKTASGSGRIDLLWPGVFLAEHKTRGRDLEEALQQALSYVDVLEEHERPQWLAVSDFEYIRLQELHTGETHHFALKELPQQVERFAFLIGRQLRHLNESDPVNIEAARKMGDLHNLLEKSGYQGHALKVLLVRILFLLFGDNTGLWDERGLFYDLISDHTRSDGQDTGNILGSLFQILDTPKDKRQTGLPEHLDAFPYVNGELFAERIDMASFSPKMRQMLLDACKLDWGAVSPAIFGSMFQAVMDSTERRELGAHYTSEANILKALRPLFLDELYKQREAARGNKAKLQAFLDLLPRIRIIDPACGSGNFLLLAFRELRKLELDALTEQQKGKQVLDLEQLIRVNVGQFYGIEYDEFPAQIARVAMWLADHQANIEASKKLGQHFINLPLRKAAHILHGDALEINWAEHLHLRQEIDELSRLYIVGNPPFVGSKMMSKSQRAQVVRAFENITGSGQLDYVTAWYIKAAGLLWELNISQPQLVTSAAFVSTSSITQGEQVAPVWENIIYRYEQEIIAAHRTFKWSNEAPGQAAVHCVIVQFCPKAQAGNERRIFTYTTPQSEPTEIKAANISPYLTDAPTVIVKKRTKPLREGIPPIHFGNMPLEGSRDQLKKTPNEGNLIISSQRELDLLLAAEPQAAKYIKRLLDADSFLNGKERWALWLVSASPAELDKLPRVKQRIARVREMRLASTDAGTRKLAERPSQFRDTLVPKTYLAIPRVSSERREYTPIGFLDSGTIINDALFMIPEADLYTFGMVQCRLHMDWLRLVGGRLKSDYCYSADVVYHTFPWLERSLLKSAQIKKIEDSAALILSVREKHSDSTLAQLYDPLLMPADLRSAHKALDRAVEALYGLGSESTEAQRTAVLLERYRQLVPDIHAHAPTKTPRKRKEPKSTASKAE